MISTFSALHFRNLNLSGPVQCSPRLNVLIGNNGQGKTNFLEGVHFLHHLSSFRTPRLERLLGFSHPDCWLQGKLLMGDITEKIKIHIVKQGRQLWREETLVRRLSDWVALHHLVVFHPAGLHQRKRSPAERRGVLDRFLCSTDKNYLEALRNFRQAHEQKNQLLKQGQHATLPEWNHLFARSGCAIVDARLRLTTRINGELCRIHQQLMGQQWTQNAQYQLELRLEPSLQGSQQEWESHLAKVQKREIQAGHCLYGPHRDDAPMYLGIRHDSPTRKTSLKTQSFAEYLFSQGEHRIAFLALQFTLNALFSKQFTQQNAIMLLDDLFSELDPSACERVLEQLDQHSNQTFITTTQANQAILPKQATVFRVDQGMVTNLQQV